MCRSCYLSKVSSKSGPKGNKIFVLYIDQDDVKKGCGFRSRFLSSRTLFYVISKEALARRVHQQHDLNNNKRKKERKKSGPTHILMMDDYYCGRGIARKFLI